MLTLNFSQLFEYLYFSFIPSLIFSAQFILARARIAIGKISLWLFQK